MTDGHLTHGWEPDLPSADSVTRAFVLAQAPREQPAGFCARSKLR